MLYQRCFSCLLILVPLAVRSLPGPESGAGAAPRPKAGVQKDRSGQSGSSASASRQTTEPQPPLGIASETAALQKNARGGVASIVFKVTAGMPIEEAVLSARASSRVVFADGSTERTWKLDLSAGGTIAVPVEVIVAEDGRYTISVEVSGKAEGKAIRRALSHKLSVGVKERKGKNKDGAIEYPAAEARPASETQPGEPAP